MYYETIDILFKNNSDLDDKLNACVKKGCKVAVYREKWFGSQHGGIAIITFEVND